MTGETIEDLLSKFLCVLFENEEDLADGNDDNTGCLGPKVTRVPGKQQKKSCERVDIGVLVLGFIEAFLDDRDYRRVALMKSWESLVDWQPRADKPRSDRGSEAARTDNCRLPI